MLIKNISGSTLNLALGRKHAAVVANNGTTVVPDNPQAIADALSLQSQGLVSIQEGPDGSELIQPQALPQHVQISLGAMAASGDGKTLTLDSVVFEFDNNATVVAGRTVVAIDGSDQLVTANALKTAINADPTLDALGVKATDVLKLSTTQVYVVLVIPPDLVLADFVATASASPVAVTKVSAVTSNALRPVFRTITATGTSAIITTGLTTIRHYSVEVRNASGGIKAYDGYVIVSGGTVMLTNTGSNSGSPNVALASTDVVKLTAFGE